MNHQSLNESLDAAAQPAPEMLARVVRHEVGNLLQKLYATVAILQARLPADWEMEHRTLAGLKDRARACKDWLEVVHDLVCPVEITVEPVDLAALVAERVVAVQERFRQTVMQTEATTPSWVRADPAQIRRAFDLVLTNAGVSRATRIVCRATISSSKDEVECTISAVGPARLAELEGASTSGSGSHYLTCARFGLALARRLVQLQGGRFTATEQPDGGFSASVILPAEAARVPP